MAPLRRPRRSRVGPLIESLIVAVAALAVVLILRPGADAAHAGAEAEAAPDSRRLDGVARVVDGDTLDVGGVRVRLHGIDAFERSQMCDGPRGPWACGAAATRALKDRAESRRLVCQVLDTDRYGRKVSRCERDGVDVAEALVANGLALAYRRYSRDYIDEELAAEAQGAGVWNGSFDRPDQWRRRSGRGSHAAAIAPAG